MGLADTPVMKLKKVKTCYLLGDIYHLHLLRDVFFLDNIPFFTGFLLIGQ